MGFNTKALKDIAKSTLMTSFDYSKYGTDREAISLLICKINSDMVGTKRILPYNYLKNIDILKTNSERASKVYPALSKCYDAFYQLVMSCTDPEKEESVNCRRVSRHFQHYWLADDNDIQSMFNMFFVPFNVVYNNFGDPIKVRGTWETFEAVLLYAFFFVLISVFIVDEFCGSEKDADFMRLLVNNGKDWRMNLGESLVYSLGTLILDIEKEG